MAFINIDVEQLNIVGLESKIRSVCKSSETMTEVHNTLAKFCDPYVPMQEGVLSQSIEITPEYVRYTQPYAHYQYTGDVYGPNIPIVDDGIVVGWFSPKGQAKKPTGARLNYSKDMHPLATDHWDQAMMRDKKDEFIAQLREIIIRRYNEQFG